MLCKAVFQQKEGELSTRILEVKDASYFMYKTNPPILVISATGTVPTSGWKNGQLSPWIYIAPPKDGIQDFDFVADPPTTFALQVICPISAQWEGVAPKWMKGFRLHSNTNALEWLFAKSKALKDGIDLRGSEIPWAKSLA
jgi:hypothetical protein